jgi:hypothetical protein
VIIIVLLRGFQLRISRSLKTADMLPSKRSWPLLENSSQT